MAQETINRESKKLLDNFGVEADSKINEATGKFGEVEEKSNSKKTKIGYKTVNTTMKFKKKVSKSYNFHYFLQKNTKNRIRSLTLSSLVSKKPRALPNPLSPC